jgi:hypothetical protein
MAWYFMLSVECGGQRVDAENLAYHFANLTLQLKDGHRVDCTYWVNSDTLGNWWAIITPKGINYGSPYGSNHALTDKQHTSEIGWMLYEHLKTAPPFRYAVVGWETEHFREYPELTEDSLLSSLHGLVMAESLAQRLDITASLEVFTPGYVWNPYQGERWPSTS